MRISTWKEPCKTAQQHMLSLISLPYGWETRFDPESGRQFIPDLSHLSSEEILQEYNLCPDCNQPNTYENWCQSCYTKKFIRSFSSWTSGNQFIDVFIQNTQIDATNMFENNWHRAIGLIDDDWKYKEFSDRDSDNLNNGLFVALKKLNDSSKIDDQFLNELKQHLNAFKMTKFLFPLLGITQDPESLEYIIVMNYAHGGSLRNIKDIRDDKIKQAIIQFRNSDKELQEISIQLTVQHAEAYFTSRTINLSEINRFSSGFKENEESDYKLFNETQIEQVDINQEI
ncbi:11536_t:CDS:2 [Dentiscutata erythropus]|uniref:11536_t:CDS:1 n=1 Tax=Dentiscutata erythropus TaxID=1348616 RepID=A0A9N9CXH9_9GLOM|nr:11536_t:CDS:2 [Dentiscutata erythropus]